MVINKLINRYVTSFTQTHIYMHTFCAQYKLDIKKYHSANLAFSTVGINDWVAIEWTIQ